MALAYTFGEIETQFGVTSIEITPPTHNDGDLLITFGNRNNDGQMTLNESGWTELAEVFNNTYGDSTQHVAYKIADSEPATLTLECGASSGLNGVCCKVTGFNSADPISGTLGTLANQTGDTANPPAVTGIVINDLVFTFIGGVQFDDPQAIVQPSGYTLDIDNQSAQRLAVATKVATATTEDPGNWTECGTDQSPDHGMVTFAIARAAGTSLLQAGATGGF